MAGAIPLQHHGDRLCFDCLAHWSRARLDHPRSGPRRYATRAALHGSTAPRRATVRNRGLSRLLLPLSGRREGYGFGSRNSPRLIPPGCNWAWRLRKVGSIKKTTRRRKSACLPSVCWIALNGIGCKPIAPAAKAFRWAGTRRVASFRTTGPDITRAWRSIFLRSAHSPIRSRTGHMRHGQQPIPSVGARKARSVISRLHRTWTSMGPNVD